MGCFLLRQGLRDHIEMMICRFWRGSKEGEKKIHWMKWPKLTERKVNGGMGFRDFKACNLAFKDGECYNVQIPLR